MRLSLAIICILGLFFWLYAPKTITTPKINGVSLVSPPRPVSDTTLLALKSIHADWVAVIPYAFSRKGEPSVTFDHERQWWGERTEGSVALITMAKQQGLSVMLKPHVWVMGEGWAGDFDLSDEADWVSWEKDYRAYILHQAILADSMGVEMLCIGTEYRKAVVKRPDFWVKLISEVREVYAGKLTYAANWDNYENVRFWSQLDFIGIDAYFPLDTAVKPSVQDLEIRWRPLVAELQQFSRKNQKPILFTEYGYQGLEHTVGNHWEIDKSRLCPDCQAEAYEALYRAIWHQDWFVGGFFWKWHLVRRPGRTLDADFSPQDKPAIDVITRYYAKTQLKE